MIYLIGSIVLTSYLIIAFKVIERLRINSFQSIVFNYITCAVTGASVGGTSPLNTTSIQAEWFSWACIMGAIFIVTFNIVAITAQRINVAVAAVAYRLSLIIPVVFAIFLYNETVLPLQWLGIVLAMLAVVLTSLPNRQTEEKNRSTHILLYVLPLILFFGSGLMDTMIKYVEQRFLNDENKNVYLSTAFASAAVIGLIALLAQIIIRKQKIESRAIIAGVLIGIPNYFSIWCLVKFLQLKSIPSSATFPINNMGIVLVSAVTAWLLFKERLSRINWIGIVLSLIGISLIAFGKNL